MSINNAPGLPYAFNFASYGSANRLNALLEAFDVVRQFNVFDIQDVNVFLFPTQHKKEECAALIGVANLHNC